MLYELLIFFDVQIKKGLKGDLVHLFLNHLQNKTS